MREFGATLTNYENELKGIAAGNGADLERLMPSVVEEIERIFRAGVREIGEELAKGLLAKARQYLEKLTEIPFLAAINAALALPFVGPAVTFAISQVFGYLKGVLFDLLGQLITKLIEGISRDFLRTAMGPLMKDSVAALLDAVTADCLRFGNGELGVACPTTWKGGGLAAVQSPWLRAIACSRTPSLVAPREATLPQTHYRGNGLV